MQEDAVWETLRWRDGSVYEGLTREGRMHRNGIMMHANGDRYEGEFEDGHMQGHGAYVWENGMVHRGQWVRDVAHGCGVRLWRGAGGHMVAQQGKFIGDEFVGPVMACSESSSHEAAVEADVAAHMAREFVTPQGRAARAQLMGRLRGQAPAASSVLQAQSSTPQGPQASQPKADASGWKFTWPWQSRANQQEARAHATVGNSGPQFTRQEPSAVPGPSTGRATKATPSTAGQSSSHGAEAALDNGSGHVSSGFLLPEGHPARDPDVGLKSRGLKEHERRMASSLVDHLMAVAAREHQQQQNA